MYLQMPALQKLNIRLNIQLIGANEALLQTVPDINV